MKGLIVVMLAGLLAGGLACIGIALKREWRTARRKRRGMTHEGRTSLTVRSWPGSQLAACC